MAKGEACKPPERLKLGLAECSFLGGAEGQLLSACGFLVGLLKWCSVLAGHSHGHGHGGVLVLDFQGALSLPTPDHYLSDTSLLRFLPR